MTTTTTSRAAALDELRRVISTHQIGPYLLTVTEHERPHVGDVVCSWQGNELVVVAPSSWPGSERQSHLDVCLLWPPSEPDGYSLIVDGTARSTATGLSIRPTRAVHYRPATSKSGEGCEADCIPILSR